MTELAIKAEGLGKRYRIGQRERYLALRDVVTNALKAPLHFFNGANGNGQAHENNFIWSLKDVSLEIKQGEAVGLIGRNGAGKTTLLKILARVTRPTEGRAEVRGRIGSLLEVGTGFHPELTGRENIYLNGAILGMSKQEIVRKFDEMVAFSGVETFIDTPLKHYSTGMQMRLAFSVAAHLEPEILLVDEVLAVGDLEFQKKCLGKMEEVTRQGRTVLFVSHNMGAIRRLCARGIWLHGGQVHRLGTADECVDAYSASFESLSDAGSGCFDLKQRKDRSSWGGARMTEVRLRGGDGLTRASFDFSEPFTIELDIEAREATRSCFVGVTILAADGTSVLGTHHSDTAEVRDFEANRDYTVVCHFEPNLLKPGIYALQVGLLDYTTWECRDWFYSVGQFQISEGTGKFGRVADRRPAYVHPVMHWEWK